MRSSLYLIPLLVPASLGLSGCRISYDLFDNSDGSFGGAGPQALGGANNGTGAGPSDGSGGDDSSSDGSGGDDSSGGGSDGGSDSGGTSAGGADTGGASSGGTSAGGADTGGASSGGAGSGGSGGSGGTPPDFPVTTAADENDPGATVSSPGQTGLSLREAIILANALPGAQTVGVPTGTLALGSVLPLITDALTIVGDGSTLDFSATSGASPCLHTDASDVSIQSIEVMGCSGEPLYLSDPAATGLEILGCNIHDNAQPVSVFGTGALVEGNLIAGSGAACLAMYGSASEVRDNQVFDCDSHGIFLHSNAAGAVLVGNLVVRGDVGVTVGNLTGATLWFNTVVDSAGNGVGIGLASGIDFRNNIVTGSGSWGLSASDNRFTVITHNLLFANTTGGCSSCTPGAPYLTSDPLYVSAGTGDYSLQIGSPAIDAGVDVGEDRNGSGAGSYDGSAPDLGFVE